MSSLRERLQEILIKNKLISEDDLKLALQVQKEHGGKLSDCLVKLNLINERDLLIALSEGLGFPPISLARFKIELDLLKVIPKDMAKHYQIIPVAKMGKTLTVAMADPLNIFAMDAVAMPFPTPEITPPTTTIIFMKKHHNLKREVLE